MKNRIFIIRHAQSEANVKNVFSVDTVDDWGVPLTKLGEEQSVQLGLNLKSIANVYKIDKVYCSPYKRAIQTMELSLKSFDKYDVSVDTRLSERRVVAYEGLKEEFHELIRGDTAKQFFYSSPHIESLCAVCDRAYTFLDGILHEEPSGKTILVYTHMMWAWCALTKLRHKGVFNPFTYEVNPVLKNANFIHFDLYENGNLIEVPYADV